MANCQVLPNEVFMKTRRRILYLTSFVALLVAVIVALLEIRHRPDLQVNSGLRYDPPIAFDLREGAWFTENRGVPVRIHSRYNERLEVRASAYIGPDKVPSVTRELGRAMLEPGGSVEFVLP